MSEEIDERQRPAESPGEQRTLEEASAEERTETLHERVFDLYNSSEPFEVAIGFWLKLGFEAVVVAVPLILLVLVPIWALVWIGFVSLTYFEGVTIWLSLSTTILLAVWCFSEPTTND